MTDLMSAQDDANTEWQRKPSLFLAVSIGIVALSFLYVLSSGPFYAKYDFDGPMSRIYYPLVRRRGG